MPDPSISVVMPIYQTRQDYVHAALTSLVAQELRDWELIIVEDPSSCESKATVGSFADSRFHYFCNAERTSLISQRNLALSKCRAPVVAMLDSDDIAEPNRLFEQSAFLRANPSIDVVGCQLSIIDGEGAIVANRDYPLDHLSIRRGMKLRNLIPQPGVMFRRDTVVASGAYQYARNNGPEDFDLWCRLLKNGSQFANHPERLQRYRIHSGQIKQQRLRDQLLGTIEVKKTHFRGELGIRGWTRIYCEHALLFLPAWFVMKLFSNTYFRAIPGSNK